ncbi:MAG: CHAT domain-containing tetratricopeptide repeat protein [Bryobacteraceae bacterium]
MILVLALVLVAASNSSGQQAGSLVAIQQLMRDGRWAEAEPMARQALAELHKESPESAATAEMLDALVEICFYSSRVNDPQDTALAERVLALKTKLYGAKSAGMALSLRLAARLSIRDYDFVRARTLLDRAQEIHQSLGEADDLGERAEAWNESGLLLRSIDDFESAKVRYERALPLYTKSLGPRHEKVAVCLNNLAAVLARLGDYAGAKARYQRALEIYENSVGPKHPLVAGCLNNYGVLLTETGEVAEAVELLRRSVEIAEASYGPDHKRTAIALNNLGWALSASGQYDAAAPLLDRALQIRGAAYGPSHILIARTLCDMASNLALSGKTEEAVETAVRAEGIARAYEMIAIRTVTEREALLYAAAKARMGATGLDTLLSLAAAKEPSARALDALIRSRALVFDEMAARHRAVKTGDPEIARLAEALESARQDLSQLTVRGPGSAPRAQFEASVDRAREAKDAAERLLAQKSIRLRQEVEERRAGLPEIASALAKDAALISFVCYRHRNLRLNRPSENPAEQSVTSYLAFVLRPGEPQPAALYLGSAKEIDSLVTEVRRKVGQEAMDPALSPKASEEGYRRAAGRLREKIWDPLAPALGGARRVFVVPDGALNLVNFASLPIGRVGYLVEKPFLIHYLSTERDLVLAPSAALGTGLLVVGDPAFGSRPAGTMLARTYRGARSNCTDFQALRFGPLPETALEAKEVAAIWQTAQAGPVVRLSGAEAREAAFQEQASGKRVLHLATHGFFLGGCRAVLTDPASGTSENPLLLSGLALAGANGRGATGPADDLGIVTAEQIAAMDLEGVEWAVLSACNTGLGELRAGEGIFGLRRAFQAAGVRTVIAGLWPAEDESTRRWMQALYRSRFLAGMSTSEAVREATLSMLLAQRSHHLSTHPLYWGGFVAVGDWR